MVMLLWLENVHFGHFVEMGARGPPQRVHVFISASRVEKPFSQDQLRHRVRTLLAERT